MTEPDSLTAILTDSAVARPLMCRDTGLATVDDAPGPDDPAGPIEPEPLDVDEPAAPAVALDPVAIAPGARLDKGIAVLRVSIADDPAGTRFQLAGDCPGLPLPDTVSDRQRRPDLALADLSSDLRPWEVGRQLRSWSETKDELTEWLNALLARHGESLRLIIDDRTGWEIPWELFWLPGSGSPYGAPGWLGAIVPVARRTAPRRPGAIDQSTDRHDCCGEVVAYVDAAMSGDGEVLGRYGVIPLEDLDAVLDRLEVDDDRLGLIYLAAHGTHSSSGNEFTLGDLSVFELEQAEVAALRRARVFVFLNACHSARIMYDDRNNDLTPRGFARAFLDHGARGVIGTSTPVGVDEACAIAEDLLCRLARGVPAATALRDHRREVARHHSMLNRRQLRERDGVQRTQAMLDAFGYLYFGYPDTTVRLATTDESAPP